MEQYIRKLSECQHSEGCLREEREALIKRHERELDELDGRMSNISQQRTEIIDEFKQFLDSVDVFQQSLVDSATKQSTTSSSVNGSVSATVPKLCRAESAEASLGLDTKQPFQTLLTVDTSDQGKSNCSTPSPTYHSASHSPNPDAPSLSESPNTTIEPAAVAKVDPTEDSKQNGKNNKSGRSFKFVHRLTLSKSAGSVPSAITVASPTTTQIESMLSKVKENGHALDDKTLNKCIDLLSSRIMKDKEIANMTLNTPEPMMVESANKSKVMSPIKEEEVKEQVQIRQPKRHMAIKVREVQEEPKEAKSAKKQGKEVTRPAPIKAESVTPNKSESQSPRQPSSPRKRTETPEERRRRIEKVLFESPSRTNQGSTLSRSTNSLNDMDLHSQKRATLRPSPSLNRYGNRTKTKVRRNHSLSPLRFGQRNEDDLSEERELEELGEMRRFKSDQQLDSDSVSMLSADDSSNEADTQDNSDIGSQLLVPGLEEPDHLLAPSKVAKSQDLFSKVFFPADKTKPLLSKEEIAKTRTNTFKKKQTQSLSQDSSRGSESPESGGSSLRVDYLSHLRHNSASPELRLRERELNSLNNTHKFRCFKDFWETKTKETLDKQRNYDQWHKDNTVIGSEQPEQQPQSVSPQPKSPQSPKQTKQSSKPKGITRQERVKSTSQPVKTVQAKSTPVTSSTTNKVTTTNNITNSSTQQQPKVVTSQKTTTTPQVPIQAKQQPTPLARDVNQRESTTERSSFTVPAKSVKEPEQRPERPERPERKANSEAIENDQLMQRLRHIQHDIRQRRIKAQNNQQQQQNQQNNQEQHQAQSYGQQQSRPSIQAAKSLDLQYYPLKQPGFVPKSAAVRIIQPNGTEPPPTKNRMRLIRSTSREDALMEEPTKPVQVMTRTGQRSSANTNGHRHTVEIGHDLSHAFGPLGKQSHLVSLDSGPMRSTYF